MTLLISSLTDAIVSSVKSGHKIFICGNGGSACESDHFAGELVGKFEKKRRALPAISLSSNTAVITAIANDYGYEKVFSRQIEALGQSGDVLITLSTSGTSKNIINAAKAAAKLGIVVFPFPSRDYEKYKNLSTADLQEMHLQMIHKISRGVEEAFVEQK